MANTLSAEAFAEYVDAKTLLPTARRTRDALQERNELAHMLPNARQCGRQETLHSLDATERAQ